MKALHIVSFILVLVGALNWGLVGLFDFNLVEVLLGSGTALTKIVYILVGLSAIYLAVTHKNDCRECGSSSAAA
ncbi:MAG: DUF378 domain-containing protein [Candidatus Andersenbacteria bacterium]